MKKMNEFAMSKMSKIFVVSQIAILLLAFGFFYVFTPQLNYPKNNEVINKSIVDFNFRNANVILVDDNPDFSSPVLINSSDVNQARFNPGTYYWKAVGIIESSSREFTVNSNVGLELNEKNSTLKNVGNVPLNVSEETDSRISGLAILDVQVEYPVNETNKTIYRGEQYGK